MLQKFREYSILHSDFVDRLSGIVGGEHPHHFAIYYCCDYDKIIEPFEPPTRLADQNGINEHFLHETLLADMIPEARFHHKKISFKVSRNS